MTTNTTNNTLTIDAKLLASIKANKRQVQALVLALQDYTDNLVGLSEDAKAACRKGAQRVGADVLKRKATLTAKTPGELRQYVEGIMQKCAAVAKSLPQATWLLDHCTRECVLGELKHVNVACAFFVAEYEAARTDAEKQAKRDKQDANAKNATLQANETRKVA